MQQADVPLIHQGMIRQTVDADFSEVRLRLTLKCLLALCVFILSVTVPVIAHAGDVELVPAECWSTAFADEDIPIVMTVSGESAVDGAVRWSHSAINRTLDRGDVVVVTGEMQDEKHRGTAEFTLSPQTLREGIILKTTVSTEFITRGTRVATASHDRTMWLFPRDALAGRREWAAGLDIRLFDPEGDTASVFDTFKLPYQSIHNLAELNDPDWRGILTIGEGASLKSQASLVDTAVELAASGGRVLLLSPIDGSFALPGLDDRQQSAGPPGPTELRLARHQIIAEFDKRLDQFAWFGTANTVPARGLSFESHRDRLLAYVSDDPHAWPFVELKYADHDGVLVMCGFQVIEHWDDGPTPRYLLIRLLEALSRPAPAPKVPLP